MLQNRIISFYFIHKSWKKSAHPSLVNALSNYNIATEQGGGFLRFLFADSLSMGNAANHSSGHAGIEQSNALLMGNSWGSQLKSTTDQSVSGSLFCPIRHTLLMIKPIRSPWQLCWWGWWKLRQFMMFCYFHFKDKYICANWCKCVTQSYNFWMYY